MSDLFRQPNETAAPLDPNGVEENVVFGVVGAFLFSLAGGVLWYVLYQFGFFAAISGFVGVIAAIKGYAFFAKKESKKGIVISVIIAVVVLVIAWYLCLANDVFTAYSQWYADGEIDFQITFAEAVGNAYLFLLEPEIGPAYFTDLLIGLALGALACVQPIRAALVRAKAGNAAEAFKVAPVGAETSGEEVPSETADAGENNNDSNS